ncbi:MAG: hypothetical protein Q8P32_00265 [Candidatus Komeilibacteria bacterium]|nr:hypothetical protein [Candidatus Komeilibacteria bacterium]
MCRFLIINSQKPVNIADYLFDFAKMCQNSERNQVDGWGIAWLASTNRGELNEQSWQTKKFLNPIWESTAEFSLFPQSKVFFVHARGSSFKKHQGDVNFNQPFVEGKNIFVFNGFLNSVKLPESLEGQIGSQKIFNLLLKNNQDGPASASIKARMALEDHSNLIEGLNYAFSDGLNTTVVCRYLENPDYYAIRYYADQEKEIVSSYDFGDLPFKKLNNGEHLNLRKFSL